MVFSFRAFATLVGIILVFVTVVSQDYGETKPLYTAQDHILNLDISNFNSNVYDKKKAFFIEFYSSYCGVCINYAPLFKELAAQLQSWNPIVEIAAVNCAEEKNYALCREHAVDAYPRLKYFKYMSHSASDGVKYDGNKSKLDSVPLELAEFVRNDWSVQHPPEWPIFEMIDSSATLENVWQTLPSSTVLMGLIIGTDRRVAWAAMIAFAKDTNIRIITAPEKHQALARFRDIPEGATAKLFILKRNNPSPVYTSGNAETYAGIAESIKNQLGALGLVQEERTPPSLPVDVAEPNSVTVNWTQFEVQMLDMAAAIRYILYAEIPRKNVIDGENLNGLKLWIATTKKYAPGTVPMRRLFYRVNKWLQSVTGDITADEWLQNVKQIQDQLGHPFPNTTTYSACRGSLPHLRGFSCGVWTLIHTMSVEAYKKEKNNASFNANRDLIEPFHQFIWHFFSCKECAQHFHDGLKKRNMTVVVTPADGIIWLWKTHNIVNKFIAKTPTDDPAFPKQQFPPAFLCPKCRVRDGGEFNETAVLDFMISYYGDIKTDSLATTAGYKISDFESGKLSRVETKYLIPDIQVGAFDVDKLEESEDMLRNEGMNSNMQRRWRSFDAGDYDRRVATNMGASRSYAVWLTFIAMVVLLIYLKYRRNRSKFWKTFYYNYDYKL